MSYNVLIPRTMYRKFEMYTEWLHPRKIQFTQDDLTLQVFTTMYFPEVFEYIESMSEDVYYTDIKMLGHYDLKINGIEPTRYRNFKFYSESHYICFTLKFCGE